MYMCMYNMSHVAVVRVTSARGSSSKGKSGQGFHVIFIRSFLSQI